MSAFHAIRFVYVIYRLWCTYMYVVMVNRPCVDHLDVVWVSVGNEAMGMWGDAQFRRLSPTVAVCYYSAYHQLSQLY